MKIILRVGETATDLRDCNRVAVEKIGARFFLVGVLKSGKVKALYAVKEGTKPEPVMEAIHAVLGSGRTVCVLTDELRDIPTDADAQKQLDNFRGEVGRPNTLAQALATGAA